MSIHPFARHMRSLRGKRPVRQIAALGTSISLIGRMESYPHYRQDGSLMQPTREQLEEVARVYGVSADDLQAMLLPDDARDSRVVEQERRSAMYAKFVKVCTRHTSFSPCDRPDIPAHCDLCGWDSMRAMAEIESKEA